MKELTSRRGGVSKTYDLGQGIRRLVIGGGIQHWKEDYSDKSEEWKECDLRWNGNRIDKAPYILERDGSKITFTDRKTGETSTLELVSVKPAGLKFEIIPFSTGVHFQHKLPNLNVPFAAQFKVEGKAPRSRAYDDIGELELEVSYDEETGVLTERLTEVRDADSKELRQASGEIRIDPTVTIQPSSKDTMLNSYSTTFNYGSTADLYVGRDFTSPFIRIWRDLVAFAPEWGVDIPAGATLISASLELYVTSQSLAFEKEFKAQRLLRRDWVEAEATWDIYKTGNNWSTAGAANDGLDYTSVDEATASGVWAPDWISWDVLIQVQWAQTNDTTVDFRVVRTDESALEYFVFCSKEYATEANRPRLVIEYSGDAIPHMTAPMASKVMAAGAI